MLSIFDRIKSYWQCHFLRFGCALAYALARCISFVPEGGGANIYETCCFSSIVLLRCKLGLNYVRELENHLLLVTLCRSPQSTCPKFSCWSIIQERNRCWISGIYHEQVEINLPWLDPLKWYRWYHSPVVASSMKTIITSKTALFSPETELDFNSPVFRRCEFWKFNPCLSRSLDVPEFWVGIIFKLINQGIS